MSELEQIDPWRFTARKGSAHGLGDCPGLHQGGPVGWYAGSPSALGHLHSRTNHER